MSDPLLATLLAVAKAIAERKRLERAERRRRLELLSPTRQEP